MEKNGIRRLRAGDVSQAQREVLLKQFKDETMSMIAPIAVDDADSFPRLSGARLCMCVRLKTDVRAQLAPPTEPMESVEEAAERQADRYVLLPFSRSQKRFWTLPSDTGYQYILFEDVVSMFLSEFFAEQQIMEASVFLSLIHI